MATKNYSLRKETIETVRHLAESTRHTQGLIIDIAVAELARTAVEPDGAINLPVHSVTSGQRRARTATAAHLDHIAGVRQGVAAA